MGHHMTADRFVKAVTSCCIGHVRVRSDTQQYDIGHEFLFFKLNIKSNMECNQNYAQGRQLNSHLQKLVSKQDLMLTSKVSLFIETSRF